jgi:hypothetical protein
MKRFEFLIGNWNLEYHVPKSRFSEAMTGNGTGMFRRALGGKFVYFDYHASLRREAVAAPSLPIEVEAHGVFAWDPRSNNYRYWWFENSGNFMRATCNFISDDVLFLSWDESALKQTFERTSQGKVILRMEQSAHENSHELILEVLLTKK